MNLAAIKQTGAKWDVSISHLASHSQQRTAEHLAGMTLAELFEIEPQQMVSL
jgi:hypothetical protein